MTKDKTFFFISFDRLARFIAGLIHRDYADERSNARATSPRRRIQWNAYRNVRPEHHQARSFCAAGTTQYIRTAYPGKCRFLGQTQPDRQQTALFLPHAGPGRV